MRHVKRDLLQRSSNISAAGEAVIETRDWTTASDVSVTWHSWRRTTDNKICDSDRRDEQCIDRRRETIGAVCIISCLSINQQVEQVQPTYSRHTCSHLSPSNPHTHTLVNHWINRPRTYSWCNPTRGSQHRTYQSLLNARNHFILVCTGPDGRFSLHGTHNRPN